MPRCIVTATITVGLVSVPIKVYTAASPEKIEFNLLSKEGNRVKQQLVDTVTHTVVDKETCDRGFEHTKGQFIRFTQNELKKLESKSDGTIVIKEFVPLDTVDLVAVESTYYLGPDKGGDRSYSLLADTLRKTSRAAVAQWASRGRDKLVVIRPYKSGLILHEMYYANEVRNFDEVLATCGNFEISPLEQELGVKLVEALASEKYDTTELFDGYRKRVTDAVESRVAGRAVEEVKEAAITPNIVDILEALKRSITMVEASKGDSPAR